MSAAMINVGLMRESRFSIRNATAHPYACVTDVAKGTLLAGCDTRQLAARIWAHGVARLSDVIPLTHVPRRLVDPVGHPRGKPPPFLPPLRWRSADSSPVAKRAIEPSELAILARVRPWPPFSEISRLLETGRTIEEPLCRLVWIAVIRSRAYARRRYANARNSPPIWRTGQIDS